MADDNHERWRVVPGHRDYMASDQGRIRSHKKEPPRILSAGADPNGYRRTTLDGQHYFVQRIIALTWIGPRPDGMETNHKNHDRSDNRAVNLEYETRQGNLAKRRYSETECKFGHELTEDNLYVVPSSGARLCRICRRRRMKRRNRPACPNCLRPYEEERWSADG